MKSMSSQFHQPVLLEPFLSFVEDTAPIYNYLDCTFGRGGHAREVLERNPDCKLIAFDRDQQALDYAKEVFSKDFSGRDLRFIHDNFMSCDFEKEGLGGFDLILADLGVSSPQYDQAERGFSFYHDGPLDMRMDQTQELTAAEIINEWHEDELMDLFKELGEHRNPYRVVKAIVHDRQHEEFTTTRQLAGLIERVDGWRKKGSHPATKYFMGLRLEVNKEIDPLANALEKLILALRPEGKLCVMTFHSMEDRIVKNTFKDLKHLGLILTKKVIQATREEIAENPRSRSAKLRVFQRGE